MIKASQRIQVSRHAGYFLARRIVAGHKLRRLYAGQRYEDAEIPEAERYGRQPPAEHHRDGMQSPLAWGT